MARVGVLALQGDFREHIRTLESLAAETLPVRKPEELDSVDGLVIPGGESTTIGRLATRYQLMDPLRSRIEGGMPTFGTCAGLIFLAARITDGDQPLLQVLDVTVQRNAFGRQNESFETSLEVIGLSEPFPAVFIRAPWVEKVGADVEVLAEVDEHPVLVRQDHILAASFHPELTGDLRLHEVFVRGI